MKRIIIFCFVIIVLYVFGVVVLNLPQKNANVNQDTSFTVPSPTGTQKTANLKSEDEKVGNGAEAKSGDTVTVNYVGTLTNGKQFESTYDRKEPFTFTLGQGQVIPGWDKGITGMRVGGKRKLTIPPELGYGAVAQRTIPANSTLIFEIELLSVTPGTAQPSNSQNPNINL